MRNKSAEGARYLQKWGKLETTTLPRLRVKCKTLEGELDTIDYNFIYIIAMNEGIS